MIILKQTGNWNGRIVTLSRLCSSGQGCIIFNGEIQRGTAISICFKFSRSWPKVNGTMSTSLKIY